MMILFAIPAAGLLGILGASIAPLFDFRNRPLPGSVGTCAFGSLPEPVEPPPADAIGELQPAA